MKSLGYFLLLITLSSCLKKKESMDLILGKWNGESKVRIMNGDTVDYSTAQKGYVNEDVLIFNIDSTYYISYFGETPFDTVRYYVSKNTLYAGKTACPLIILNDSILVYKAYLNSEEYLIMGYRKEE